MEIELGFDQWTYRHKTLYGCADAQTVEKFLQTFIKTKFDRGYRLRVIPDYALNTVEVQSPCIERLRIAKRALREHFSKGFCREIRWVNVWQIMENQSGKAWK